MATPLFANVAGTTLAGGITAADTSVSLAAGTGSLFPSPGAGQYFSMTFNDAATGIEREIVQVTARSGDVCTIVRAQEGTTAQAWLAGDKAANKLTAGTMAAILALFAGPYVDLGGGTGQLTTLLQMGQISSGKITIVAGGSNLGNVAFETWVSANFAALSGAVFTGGVTAPSLDVTGTGSFATLGVTGGFTVFGTIDTSSQILLNNGAYSSGAYLTGTANGNSNPFVNASPGTVIFPSGQINSFTGNAWALGNSGGTLLSLGMNGAFVGSISVTPSAVSFNTGSDHRLKVNVEPLTNAIARVNSVLVHRFAFIDQVSPTNLDPPQVDGFLAHEAALGVPEAVTGTKDATTTHMNAVVAANGNVLADGVTKADWTAGKLAVAPIQPVAAIPATATTPDVPLVVGSPGSPPLYPPDSTWSASITVPVYQQIDQSKMVPVLWAAVQELSAQVAALIAAQPQTPSN
jgi:hypothetical protein